jgi:hypothetical protein
MATKVLASLDWSEMINQKLEAPEGFSFNLLTTTHRRNRRHWLSAHCFNSEDSTYGHVPLATETLARVASLFARLEAPLGLESEGTSL